MPDALKKEAAHHYTFVDYMQWPEDYRAEIIHGVLYEMSAPFTDKDGVVREMATPTENHHRIVMELSRQIANFLDGKPCKVFPAPYTVKPFAEDDDVLVEPDITVVCDEKKREEWGCNGAPNLVVEVLSPSTARKDRWQKYNRYEEAGVREYWIVDPENELVEQNVLENGAYKVKKYDSALSLPSSALQGLEINLQKVFLQKVLPKG